MTQQGISGKVVQILGAVVDVAFSQEQMPNIYDAVEVPREGQDTLVLEIQQHLGDGFVRCVAMDATDGLQRGTARLRSAAARPPARQPPLARIQRTECKNPNDNERYDSTLHLIASFALAARLSSRSWQARVKEFRSVCTVRKAAACRYSVSRRRIPHDA